MAAQKCFSQPGLTTYALRLLGVYAEVWCWPDGAKISLAIWPKSRRGF